MKYSLPLVIFIYTKEIFSNYCALSIYHFTAKDHRILVVCSNTTKDPLKASIQKVKQLKRDKAEQAKIAKASEKGRRVDPCKPHTKLVGGKEKVIITEKIGGQDIDQKDEVNNQA